jgi:branched-chain amino acid transport system substrate-binding protein
MKRLFHFSILLSFVFWLNACDQAPAIQPSGKMIKIGIIAPFSGFDLAKGREGLNGMETALQLQPYAHNRDGIELIWENDKDDPALTVRLLEKLVKEDNVSAIVTFSSSGPVLAMAAVADTYKTPILAALATHPDTTEHNDYISQLCFDDTFQGTVAALFVRDELLFDSVAVFSNPDSNYSSNLATEFERKFKSLGGRITDRVFLTEQTKDQAYTLKSVYAKNPELLYLPVKARDVIEVIKATEELDWNPRVMASDGLLATIFAQHDEELDLLEGILATDFYHSAMPLTAYGKKIRAIYDGKATSYAALGIEAYALLLDAMNRCSMPDDRECINNEIRATTLFTGLMGKITIDSNGKAERPLVINSIKDGEMRFVVKVY